MEWIIGEQLRQPVQKERREIPASSYCSCRSDHRIGGSKGVGHAKAPCGRREWRVFKLAGAFDTG
jgi:hypothetical protein